MNRKGAIAEYGAVLAIALFFVGAHMTLASGSYPYTSTVIATTTLDASNTQETWNILQQGSNLYVGSVPLTTHNNELIVLNVSSSTNPQVISKTVTLNGTGTTGNLGIAIQGNYLYMGVYTSQFQVMDITNPAAPVMVGSTTIPCSQVYSVAAAGNYAYAACNPGSIAIMNIANPLAPFAVGTIAAPPSSNPQSLFVSGNVLYVSAASETTSTIAAYSISNPSSPVLLSDPAVDHSPQRIAIRGNLVGDMTHDTNELELIDFSNPLSPVTSTVSLSAGCDPESQNGILLAGNRAFVGCLSGGIDVINISATSSPQLLGLAVSQIANVNGEGAMVLAGSYLYMGDEHSDEIYTIYFGLDDSLSSLAVSSGTLSPAFSSSTFTYNDVLPHGTVAVPTVTPTLDDPQATSTVTQATSTSGTARIVVTSQDTTQSSTYTVNFSVASNDASLSSLTTSAGTLSPSFSSSTTSYTDILPPGTTSVPTVAAVVNNANATDTITQATSLSGTATIVVTAQDGTDQTTYTVNFNVPALVVVPESAGGSGGGGSSYIPPTETSSTTPTSTVTTSSSTTITTPSSTSGQQALLLQLEATLQALLAQAAGFTRDLTLGSHGLDVLALQHYLNTHGFPVVTTPTYAGSLNYETQHFGLNTQAALAKFQASVGISPTIGYFGPITRAYVNTHP